MPDNDSPDRVFFLWFLKRPCVGDVPRRGVRPWEGAASWTQAWVLALCLFWQATEAWGLCPAQVVEGLQALPRRTSTAQPPPPARHSANEGQTSVSTRSSGGPSLAERTLVAGVPWLARRASRLQERGTAAAEDAERHLSIRSDWFFRDGSGSGSLPLPTLQARIALSAPHEVYTIDELRLGLPGHHLWLVYRPEEEEEDPTHSLELRFTW